MVGCEQLVRPRREQRTGLQRPAFTLTTLPQPRDGERLAVTHVEVEGPLTVVHGAANRRSSQRVLLWKLFASANSNFNLMTHNVSVKRRPTSSCFETHLHRISEVHTHLSVRASSVGVCDASASLDSTGGGAIPLAALRAATRYAALTGLCF